MSLPRAFVASPAIATTVAGLGYELVDVERAPGGLLRVTIDHLISDADADADAESEGARAITVDDCEKVTRQLQHVLEVEGLAYERLEVSSPGLDRPLRTPADFARFSGEQVEVTLKEPFRGRKRYRGELLAAEGAWRLVLAGADDRLAGHKAKGRPPVKAKLKAGVSDEPAEVLDFSLDEVREARLVPVVDFKGRRAARPGRGTPEAQDEMKGVQTQ